MEEKLTTEDYISTETKQAFDKFYSNTTFDEINLADIDKEVFKRALICSYEQGRSDRFEDLNSRYYFSRKEV